MTNKSSKLRTKNGLKLMMMHVELEIQIVKIKLKNTRLKSSLCDCIDARIVVKGTIIITKAGTDSATRQADKRNKQVTFKNFTSFIDCISEINNTQVDNKKDLDVVILMCNLIECSNNYAKYQEVYDSITKMIQMIK